MKIQGNRLIAWLQKADRKLLDILYPPRCPFCDRVTATQQEICLKCRTKIRKITEPLCKKCGKPLDNERMEYCMDCQKSQPAFVQGKALWIYEKKVKNSIYRFKYQNKREYAFVYAKELAETCGEWIRRKQIDLIVPVPLHKERKRSRGYNQAEILAKELGRYLGIPVSTKLLVRVKNTKPQKLLSAAERKNNLKKAFKTVENIVQLKHIRHILVVDDIYTTGSTLNSAALALMEAGVTEVYTCCISIGKG